MGRSDLYKSLLFGVAVGDALGVPVEFKSRFYLHEHPVRGMTGYGTHEVPPGTWSDDSSLTFCLAEAMVSGFDLELMGRNFVRWYYQSFWTSTGAVFDIGILTSVAIQRLQRGTRPDLAGNRDEDSNGNGSLMRIAPLAFHLEDKSPEERFDLTRRVSSVTHGHIRSVIACFYYLEFARKLFSSDDKHTIYHELQEEIPPFLKSLSIDPGEISLFDRLLKGNIHKRHEDEIKSDGYVLHTLEASIWCLMRGDSYRETVLKAVNLGFDTDTTGAVTGGLAGLLYGFDSIPENWINTLARKDDIEDLALRMCRCQVV